MIYFYHYYNEIHTQYLVNNVLIFESQEIHSYLWRFLPFLKRIIPRLYRPSPSFPCNSWLFHVIIFLWKLRLKRTLGKPFIAFSTGFLPSTMTAELYAAQSAVFVPAMKLIQMPKTGKWESISGQGKIKYIKKKTPGSCGLQKEQKIMSFLHPGRKKYILSAVKRRPFARAICGLCNAGPTR